jgi:hypothetical protein
MTTTTRTCKMISLGISSLSAVYINSLSERKDCVLRTPGCALSGGG